MSIDVNDSPAASATENPAPAPGEPTTGEKASRAVAEAARETEWNKPSFAKGVFLGSFDLSLIHPHPRPPADDVARGEEFLENLTTYCRTLDGRRIERDGVIPDEYLRGLSGLGAWGMKIPRDYGGLGLSLSYYGRALELIGSVHPSMGAMISAHQSIGVPEPVLQFGTAEQKDRYLPRCAAGAITAFLLTEPDFGSDPARMATTATPVSADAGDAYLIDGLKLWSTNGPIAELNVVMAKVPPHGAERGGITAFIVDMDAEGITVENRNSFMGLRGIENGVTRFQRVRVPVPAAKPDRPGGPGAEDRPDDAQHRTAVDPGDVCRGGQVGARDRAAKVGGAGAVGQADRSA